MTIALIQGCPILKKLEISSCLLSHKVLDLNEVWCLVERFIGIIRFLVVYFHVIVVEGSTLAVVI